MEEEDVENGDQKPGNEDNKDTVEPKEIVNKDLGIGKITSGEGPVAISGVAFRDEDWSIGKKLGYLN